MLQIRGVTLDYEGAVALAGVDLDVDDGELVALVGANGAGKSSLLAAVSGLHRPIGGCVVLDGEDISALPAHEVVRRGIALVPEGRHLFARLTVRQNLTLGAHRQRDPRLRAEDLERVHTLFPILAQRAEQLAGTLSGGEQQMVALGRALMSRPRLLMLDEPSLGVAPALVDRIFDALRTIHSEGVTMLLVEQNLQAALELATRAYVLQTGKVVLSGTGAALSASDDVRRAYLGM